MKTYSTALSGVLIVQLDLFKDGRGFFMESYQARNYAAAGIATNFVQDNYSGSRRGVLRGLHYQIQQPQGKLVHIITGEVYDVVVDLRRSSPTFGQWISKVIKAEEKRQLWVPAGCAHGFFVLSEWAEIVYKCTDYYAPQWERSLLWNDPQLAVPWPLIDGQAPVLSAKDAAGKLLAEADLFE